MTIEMAADTYFRIGHSRFGVATSDPTTQPILVFVQEFLSLIQNENSRHVE